MADDFSRKFSQEFRFAIDSNTSTTAFKLISSGIPTVHIPAQGRITFVSDNANDTLTGTGAQKIRLFYLDDNYNPFEEIISLNGTTPVDTVATNIRHSERFEVIQVGSNNSNLGTISLKDAGGTTYFTILPGENEFFSCLHHVTRGKRMYITGINASLLTVGVVQIRLIVETTHPSGNTIRKIVYFDSISNNETISREFISTISAESGNHVFMQAKCSVSGMILTGTINFFEVDV